MGSTNIELAHLNRLLEFYDLSPVRVDHRDRPDFLVTFEDRSVVVEHTEVLHREQTAAGASLDRLKCLVLETLEGRCNHLSVILYCNVDEAIDLDKHRRIVLAEQLVEEALKLEKSLSATVQFSEQKLDSHGPVEFMMVFASEKTRVGMPRHQRGGGDLPVRVALERKGKKLPSYQQAVDADEFWLLLVSGQRDGAIDNCILAKQYKPFGWDKVFFLNVASGECVLLTCEVSDDH